MIVRLLPLLCILLTISLVAGCTQPALANGLHRNVTFVDYSSLSRSNEIMRRLVSPLDAIQMHRKLAGSDLKMRRQVIDLQNEKFAIYVPHGAPPQSGYALLVFVPPWRTAIVPMAWMSVLNHHHMLFVTAANSGNNVSPLDRRIPLALLAEQNMIRLYPVDPLHIYVGGFSGGGRVAEMLALAYPDVFDGALLEAGSDPIGDAARPLPPTSLFHRFQESSQLVFLTGSKDDTHLAWDRRSRRSLRHWCVFNQVVITVPFVGHKLVGGAALNRALNALSRRPKPDHGKLAACRSRIQGKLTAKLQRLRSLLTKGELGHARQILARIDTRYGGLAAPSSVELMKKINRRRNKYGNGHKTKSH